MNEVKETLILLPDNHPFLGMSLASYSMMNGITVVHEWKFEDKNMEHLTDLFKIPLGNVHRQDDSSFEEWPCTIAEIRDTNTTMVCSKFMTGSQKTAKYYAFSFFIRYDRMKKNPELQEILTNRVVDCAAICKQTLLQPGRPFLWITPKITQILTELCFILDCKAVDRPIGKLDGNVEFYSAALTAHLCSEMTTVIEHDGSQASTDLYNFLAQFLLPYQRELSSIEPHACAAPGLFLQCVVPQKDLPLENLMEFQRPWTWIQPSKKAIMRSPDIETQLSVFVSYRRFSYLTMDLTDEDRHAQIQKMVKKYRMHLTWEPLSAQWCTDAIKVIAAVPNHIKKVICEQKVGELVNMAIALVEAIDSLLSVSEAAFIQPDQKTELSKELGIRKDDDEMRMIVSVAQIFDKRIYRRVQGGRKEMVMKMIHTL